MATFDDLLVAAFRNVYSDNNLDKYLGFKAPKWLDEPLNSRRINRQSDSQETVAIALANVMVEERNALSRKLHDCSMAAQVLGMKVVAEDLRAAARSVRTTEITDAMVREFCCNRSDPRIDL